MIASSFVEVPHLYDIAPAPGTGPKEDGTINPVGVGGFGTVYYAKRNRHTPKKPGEPDEVAIKILRQFQSGQAGVSEQKEFMNEVTILNNLRARTLHSLVHCAFTARKSPDEKLPQSWSNIHVSDGRTLIELQDRCPIIVTPFMKHGDASRLSADWESSVLKNQLTPKIATELMLAVIGIAEGMMILHHNGIVHRDLKPGNVLLDEVILNGNPYRVPRITDFGLSFNSSKDAPELKGTPIFIGRDTDQNYSNDVHTFGVTILCLFLHNIFGKVKIDGTNCSNVKWSNGQKTMDHTQYMDIRRNYLDGYVLIVPPNIVNKTGLIPPGYLELAYRCMNQDQSQRPSFVEIHRTLIEDFNIIHNNQPNPGRHLCYTTDHVDRDAIAQYINEDFLPFRTKQPIDRKIPNYIDIPEPENPVIGNVCI